MTPTEGVMVLFGLLYVGRELVVWGCRPRPARPRPRRRTWADDQ